MLSLLLILPVIGALVIGFFPGNIQAKQLRQITELFAVLTLVWSLLILFKFDINNSQLQFQEYLPWIPQLGLNYSLGVDGLSLPLVILNSLLTGVAIYSIGPNIDRSRLYYALILLINAGISGALLSQNLLLFIIFYELELIPFYLMIAIWGGEKRGYASMKFLLYTAFSGLLVLAAFLGISLLGGSYSFDYNPQVTQTFTDSAQTILLILILLGFGIKIPLVPLHTWLPDAYTEASPAVAILLGGILAKLGAYGIIRFGLQLFPQTWAQFAPVLAIIGTVTVLYGALSAIAQKDIKRMVAYSSIGHMGYILVAAAAGTELSVLGAVAQMVSHGLILALLFHLVGIVERKAGTRDLNVLNGLMNPIRGLPLTSALLITGGMASAGIPGLVGFAAEFIVFQGSFTTFPIPTLLCILASGLTAVYFVILLNRTCFGKLDNQRAYYPKVLASEMLPALVLTAIIFFLGVQPNYLVQWTQTTTNEMIAQIPHSSPAVEQLAQGAVTLPQP
ncbi:MULTISPECIES: NADH-quinone oxidoreductase subunit M [unclassified Synechocystis]|uniref:NADH-quinone oxidoreductase subunit M n=1 Tax=unclassified Synechocystis TaxID=2640012 RepID=UPI00041843E0|nr:MULTISPECIES: NADH-quinone oxidoreductase subunit M [unclassified Synechocystis]AIE75385.1 NADH dehydrogenase subunit 4, Involved in CO2 fixation [Synechocystis sp. PCC 6714]MCT0253616.1 NADH-quinone oxidoreductase subunit M [Synechocystis sp. CS-94]